MIFIVVLSVEAESSFAVQNTEGVTSTQQQTSEIANADSSSVCPTNPAGHVAFTTNQQQAVLPSSDSGDDVQLTTSTPNAVSNSRSAHDSAVTDSDRPVDGAAPKDAQVDSLVLPDNKSNAQRSIDPSEEVAKTLQVQDSSKMSTSMPRQVIVLPDGNILVPISGASSLVSSSSMQSGSKQDAETAISTRGQQQAIVTADGKCLVAVQKPGMESALPVFKVSSCMSSAHT